MGALIDALLSLSRVTRSDLSPSTVDLSSIARDVINKLAFAEPGRHVHTDVEDGLHAYIDPPLARTLLENLIGNAWKFTGQSPSARVTIASREWDGMRTLFVADNGAGFDMAHAENLFRPFQRLHTLGEFQGTGIGLATAQRIVHRHGGRIWAEGEVGAGATFYFTLPAASVGAP
jgi:light-regulated signal transduction histidine kinase (bacteriophytochrome)